MNAYKFKSLLCVALTSLIIFSSCGTSHKTSGNYTKNRSHGSIAKSKPSKSRTYHAPSKTERISSNQDLRNRLVADASKYKGTPYVYGGKQPTGFDCSGFTTYVFNLNGVSISGSSTSLAKLGTPVSVKKVQAGDLLFFGSHGKVSHVAIVASHKNGALELVHSTSKRGVVRENITYSEYWQKRILFARDIISKET